ncbi:hypothetical protein B9T62_29365 [Paenibacillus donghaensis]|uniref:DNA/RNA helicase n=2 Tax=Paenibacillus donghaensis TaxID=414771 RepID=A0A2Z2KKG3_9BACL|nr:hypothetical protein B9T62_29365 [Paenibacillus donghaensis]
MVILSSGLPLGWAVKLRSGFRPRGGMKSWASAEWAAYIDGSLANELKEEHEARGEAGKPGKWPVDEIAVWRREAGWDEDKAAREGARSQIAGGGGEVGLKGVDGSGEWGVGIGNGIQMVVGDRGAGLRAEGGSGEWGMGMGAAALQELQRSADALLGLFGGRSLLQPEAEALLAERLPGLAGRWRGAAQLAQLQGRLTLDAALSAPAPAAPGALRRAAALLPHLPWRGAAAHRALRPRCLRCGSEATGRTACAACGLQGCAYCEACLALGRSRACALLLRSAALPAVRGTAGGGPTVAARRWGLSAAQAGAAGAALAFLAEPARRSAASCPERFLLWAVTGAGKTEMIFPLLESVLAAGGRALVATPRRDVVLELVPRLAKAFPAVSRAVLYGGSAERWADGQLTLATTHQLLRFHQGFDLVIIDELDAYPYHNDPMLAYAAEQACKPDGCFIYLSATPPAQLQREARRGKLAHARVPVRFHGHPLPVPQHLVMESVQQCLKHGRLPRKLVQVLQRSLDREAQIFLFVSRIAHIEGLLKLLRHCFPGRSIEGTSSQDAERAEKVSAFRNRDISLLVTTTILERGVTVPRSDVIILDADSSLFDEASLVQMAGRAGRSKEDPAGHVVFASAQWSRAQRGAIAQIRTMNGIARRQGYIHKEGL